MLEALDCLIIEVQMGRAKVRSAGDPVLAAKDRESMVLRRDLDRSIVEATDGVVAPPMPVEELVRGRAESPTDELMSQADTEDRLVSLRESPDRLENVTDGLRIPRAVGNEKSVERLLEDRLRRRRGGQDGDLAAALRQQLQRVGLHAEIEGEDA